MLNTSIPKRDRGKRELNNKVNQTSKVSGLKGNIKFHKGRVTTSSARASLNEHTRLKEADKYVIFNTGHMSVKQIWDELRAILPKDMSDGILKLNKVTGALGVQRIDMWVSNAIANTLKSALRERTRQRTPYFMKSIKQNHGQLYDGRRQVLSKWRIEPFKPWRDRKADPVQPNNPTSSVWRDNVMTLNINGFHSKSVELESLLHKEQISIACIQETLASPDAYPVKFNNYTTFAMPWKDGFRGMAILVRDHLTSYEVMRRNSSYIYVKVSGLKGIGKPLHLIGVYLPSGGNYSAERNKVMREIMLRVSFIRKRDPTSPIMILGDTNTETERIDKILKSGKIGLERFKPRGSPVSRFGANNELSAIDHIIVNDITARHFRRPRIFRQYALSDHRPVITRLRVMNGTLNEQKPPELVFDSLAGKKFARTLIHSNRFALLAETTLDTQDDLNKVNTEFVDIYQSTCKELGIIKPRVQCKPRMNKSLMKQLKHRNDTANKVCTLLAKGKLVPPKLNNTLEKSKSKFKASYKAWASEMEILQVKSVCESIRSNDYKTVWARIRNLTTTNVASKGISPVINKSGKLCTTDTDILAAIGEHYNSLANDDLGNSQNAKYWENKSVEHPTEFKESLNEPLEWREILMAIRSMNRNTAPSPKDLIHVNILKELGHEENLIWYYSQRPELTRLDAVQRALSEVELPEEPQTSMGMCIWKIIITVWELRVPPDQWNEVFICNLFKSGNPELLSNYRGISLIAVVLKVLLSVMARRLYREFNDEILVREQAGFRPNEEAVAQFIMFAEVIRRREINGLATYAIYVDFQKAFDKVPHEGLWKVLSEYGVGGAYLDILKNIYQHSKLTVRAGKLFSNSFGMGRGSRQGCPLSPLVYIIYSNDLLRLVSAGGVRVPGVPNNIEGGVCKGGTYADDLVGFEETLVNAETFIDNTHAWGEEWGMTMGLQKCGIQLFNGSDEQQQEFDRYKQPGASQTVSCPDGDIPCVDEYKYLGFTAMNDLGSMNSTNLIKFARIQAGKGMDVLQTLRPILRDRRWPMIVKVNVLRTILMSKMMYGSEWLGYKQSNAEPIQRIMNKGMKLALGCSSKSVEIHSFTLAYELGIPWVAVEQNAQRARIHAKLMYTNKFKTWLKVLNDHPIKSRQSTWVTGNTKWENSYVNKPEFKEKYNGVPLRPWAERGLESETQVRCNSYRVEGHELAMDVSSNFDRWGQKTHDAFGKLTITEVIQSAWSVTPLNEEPTYERMWRNKLTRDTNEKTELEWQHIQMVREVSLERCMTNQKSNKWDRYNKYEYGTTRGYIRTALSYPKLSIGLDWLIRIRTGSFPTLGRRIATLNVRGIKHGLKQGICPLCGEDLTSDYEWAHLLLSCTHPKVSLARENTLREPIDVISNQYSAYKAATQGECVFGNVDNTTNTCKFSDEESEVERVRAIYMTGGVELGVNLDYTRAFGHLDVLIGLSKPGFVFVAEFLKQVVSIYLKSLFIETGECDADRILDTVRANRFADPVLNLNSTVDGSESSLRGSSLNGF